MSTATAKTSPLQDAMLSAFVQQAVVMVLAGMILEGGGVFQVCLYAMAAFWGGVIALRVRRRGPPTRVDLLLTRGAYILVCIISFLVTKWIWHMRGYDML